MANVRTEEERRLHFEIRRLCDYICERNLLMHGNREEVNAVDSEGNSKLIRTLMNSCDLKSVETLLKKGADVNKTNAAGRSPLCVALQNPDCTSILVRFILNSGASLEACSMHKNLLECYAADAKQIQPNIVRLLLNKLNGLSKFKLDGLCLVLSGTTCRADMVKALLEIGCLADKCVMHSSSFNCYLDQHASNGGEPKVLDAEVVKLLLGSVAPVRMLYGSLQSPMCLALNHPTCSPAIIKLFLEAGASFRECYLHPSMFRCFLDINPHKPFVFGTDRSLDADSLKMFLDHGVDIHLGDPLGMSALDMALHHFNCNADVIKLLLDAGARTDGCTIHGSTLMCYVKTNDVNADVIKLLLDRGVDVDEVYLRGDTPMHAALRYSKYEVAAIELLMDFPGFDVHKTGRNRSPFLHCALQNSYFKPKVIELLLNRGAKADAVSGRGHTPLQIAVMNPYCDLDIMQLLLDNGCPVYMHNNRERSALEIVMNGTRRVDVVRFLLSAGAPINVKRYDNDPSMLEFAISLYEIVKKNELGCVEMFVKYAMLVTPFLDITKLIPDCIHSDLKRNEFLNFVNQCKNEIKRMDMQYVACGITLRELAAAFEKDVSEDQ